MFVRRIAATLAISVVFPISALAQSHESNGWNVMQDAVVYGLFNHQGGPRGGTELRVPNWWMGMFSRKVGSSDLTINTMLSLDALTVGKKGYRELFQVGETFGGHPLIDYQHPHDLFMQLAAVWHMPIGARTGLTLAGGPAAEPALGPVAFMHRASAMDNPMSPLGHHTFDSTHIAFGVVTAAVDRGPWTIEGSIFNGREPGEDRWDINLGPLDSYSGRVWFRPSSEWELQVSSGRLKEPEELEEGNVTRITASASWLQHGGDNFSAITAAYGVNGGEEATRGALLIEATKRAGRYTGYGRLEFVEVETGTLLDDHELGHAAKDTVAAVTVGAVRELPKWRGVESGIGAAATVYGVPDRLTVTHGKRPVSFQVFLRLRPSARAMGRMWNMHMIKPMHPLSTDPHAGHHMP